MSDPAVPTSTRNSAMVADAAPEGAAPSVKTYRAGTLTYTSRGLVILFAWLLWGDFCFTLFETVFGRFLPLYLKELKASDMWIAALSGTAAGFMNLLFLPHISMWSDRHRGRWGRRVPFLFFATPATVGSTFMIGFAPEIGGYLSSVLPAAISPVTVILLFISVFVVTFHLFNMILCNVFYCLLRDVVPEEVMPWCLSGFRIVGTLGNLLFNWFIFPHVLIHRQAVCVGVGLLYAVVFMAMCWQVKEGEYPPPPPKDKDSGNVFKTYYGYFRTCLSVPFYRTYFIAMVIFGIGGIAGGQFGTLFLQESLGMTLKEMGTLQNWCIALSLVAFLPAGFLCRKFSAPRVLIGAMLVTTALAFLSYFFIRDKQSVLVFSLLGTVPSAVYGIALGTTNMLLFPKAKYGQFSSGLNVFLFGCMIAGSLVVGYVMDQTDHNYRLHMLFSGIGGAAALVPLLMVYRGWQRYGGAKNYVPPAVE